MRLGEGMNQSVHMHSLAVARQAQRGGNDPMRELEAIVAVPGPQAQALLSAWFHI